jgi:hypothetical protein
MRGRPLLLAALTVVVGIDIYLFKIGHKLEG